MATNNRKNIGKNGGTKTSSKTVSQVAKARAGEEISSWRVVRVCIGMALLVVALFIVCSFTSYIVSGSEDKGLCDGHSAAEILRVGDESAAPVSNVCGNLGLLTAYFLINDCFGLAAYCIPIWLAIVALRLIGSFKFHVLKHFVRLGILMVWLSIVLAVVGSCMPMLDIPWHVNMGGNHGDHVHRLMLASIGAMGEWALVLLTTVFLLIYCSVRTVNGITELFRFRRIRRMRELFRKKHGGQPQAEAEATSATPQPQPVYEEPQPVTLLFDVESEDAPHPSAEELPVVDEAASQEDAGSGEPTFTIDAPQQTEQGTGEIERGSLDTPFDPTLSLEHYQFPPLSLLDHSEENDPSVDEAEQNANKERIIRVLKSFGVEIRTIRATIGATVTLYEITLTEGTRINKIRNLEDDIALSLAAEGIRIIAPIPGKGTIGIEVPNKKKCIVSMESVLGSKAYQESRMELPCALGKTITNEVFMVDLAKAPHMLVAGATGMGKSVGLNAIVTSLLYKKHPTELKIVMVDPKKVEFSIYAPIANQFLAKLEDEEEAIITDNQRVVKTLNALCKLMDDRYSLLKKAQVRNIIEYNKKIRARRLNPENGHEYMPYYVVIIDEFGDLIMTAGKEIELPICRIAQLARAVGIHMIIATQRPTTRIITGTIKANFPARIAFKVSSMIDSRIILDRPGANQLIGRGDMLYLQAADPVRVQCAFVDTPEVNRICEFISQQQQFPEMTYLPEPPMDGESGANDVDLSKLDSLFGDVARMVVAENQGSTSNIQRKFSIGYNRAGKLMDQLEKAGIVGPVNGSKPREILINDMITLDNLLHNLGVE